MRLENSFTVPCEAEAAWRLLLDVPTIAPCLPGAELTEVVGERTYKGHAKVKVGPVLLTFAGTAEIIDIDETQHRARVRARGQDQKGRGSAQAEVLFSLQPVEVGTQVSVVTDLNLTGAVAQYGRASGLMQGIAAEITREFASNLQALLAARETAPAAKQAADGEGQPATPAPSAAKPVSALALLWRTIVAALRRWLGLTATQSR